MTQELETFLDAHFRDPTAQQPYSQGLLREFLQLHPLHAFIPGELGGAFQGTYTYLRLVDTTSYYSLPLGLTLGITGTLFLQPLIKHAAPGLRDEVLSQFLTGPALGGMMITEPTGGTDIFGLQTSYTNDPSSLVLQGTKCWGGLTGLAEHWLVAARLRQRGKLTKRVRLLYVPLHSEGVEVRPLFDALGLQPIPYGETRFRRVTLPTTYLVGATASGGLRLLYDTLFRSRLGMPALAAGLCRRLAEEAAARTARRMTFGRPQSSYDQVQFRVSTLVALAELNRCLWRFTGQWMDAHDDVSTDYVLVNAAKLLCSETMQTAADSAVQLFASASYKRAHLVGRAYVDSRPFQIFEGVNEVLDENLYDTVVSRRGCFDRAALDAELQRYRLSLPADLPAAAKQTLDTATAESQREKVHLGRLAAWATALAILTHAPAGAPLAGADACRYAQRRLAELAAAYPYLS